MEQQDNYMMQHIYGGLIKNGENVDEIKPVGLNCIFEEIHRRNNSNMGEKDVKSEFSASRYREKLDEMFDGLFDKKYEEVLLGDVSGYEIYGEGRIFIYFLFDTYKLPSMKSIRKKEYENIDRFYENKLLFYASEFLKERKEHETEKDIPTDELVRTLLNKFDLNKGSFELIKALFDFNNMVNDFLYSPETKMIHKEAAEAVRKCSSVSELMSFSDEEGFENSTLELKLAKCIDNFACEITEDCDNALRNL